jgi:hypothetical protein
MRSDWVANRDELMAFWKSCKYTTADLFADSLPWLFVRGYAGRLPWAAVQLATMAGEVWGRAVAAGLYAANGEQARDWSSNDNEVGESYESKGPRCA